MNNNLIVKNLNKTFTSGYFFSRKSFIAVNNISFELKKSEILGFLGQNGAGKTTTIQLLLGLLEPTSGQIEYFNQDFTTNRSNILREVTFASGYDKLPPRLTIWDNLDIFARLYGVANKYIPERITSLLKFFDIFNLRNKPTGMLSAGQMTRVILAKAFIPNPQVVLLDEPTASLDPDVAQDVRHFILEQRKQHGVSVLFTSHNMDEVANVCDRIIMLKDGSIVANDTPKNLAASISISHLHLLISNGLNKLTEYLTQNNISYKFNDNEIIIDIEEDKIGSFLVKITRMDIDYSQISIDKPTLEDYFLEKIKSL